MGQGDALFVAIGGQVRGQHIQAQRDVRCSKIQFNSCCNKPPRRPWPLRDLARKLENGDAATG